MRRTRYICRKFPQRSRVFWIWLVWQTMNHFSCSTVNNTGWLHLTNAWIKYYKIILKLFTNFFTLSEFDTLYFIYQINIMQHNGMKANKKYWQKQKFARQLKKKYVCKQLFIQFDKLSKLCCLTISSVICYTVILVLFLLSLIHFYFLIDFIHNNHTIFNNR